MGPALPGVLRSQFEMYQLHEGQDSSHQILINLVHRYGQAPVLDVGAADGYLGRLLGSDGLSIDAVEADPASAAAAGPYYRRGGEGPPGEGVSARRGGGHRFWGRLPRPPAPPRAT